MLERQPSTVGIAAALLGVATLTIMVGSAIAPALPSIAQQMGLGQNASWLITLPALGVIVFGPLVGRMIGRQGPRPVLILGLAFYGLLGVLGAVLPGLPLVLADRFLLGGATAMVMASGTALISDVFTGEARLRMMARQGMAIELGGVVFLAAGGVLAGLGWRYPFGLYLVAWLMLGLVMTLVPRPDRQTEPERTTGTAGAQVGDIYVAATLSLLLFFTAIISLPQLLAQHGYSEAVTGYYLAFISLAAVGAAALMPRLQGRLGSRTTLLTAFAAYAVGHLIFASQPGIAMLLVAGVVMGAGFGFSVPLANHEVVERSTRANRGRNLAWLSVAIFLGQFLSSFLELANPGGSMVFAVAAVLAVLSALVYLAASRRIFKEPAHA